MPNFRRAFSFVTVTKIDPSTWAHRGEDLIAVPMFIYSGVYSRNMGGKSCSPPIEGIARINVNRYRPPPPNESLRILPTDLSLTSPAPFQRFVLVQP
jgi:hypothetical protein